MEGTDIRKLLIFGAGEGGQEVLRVIIDDINKVFRTWQVLGFIDRDLSKKDKDIFGYPVIGDRYPAETAGVFGVCGIMDNRIRSKVINEEITAKGFSLATLIHPSVVMASDFNPGPGLVVYPGSKISYGVAAGEGIIVNYNCVLGHGLSVGDHTYIGPSVTIAGGCRVGKFCTLGAGSNILQGISVGDNSTLGIGSTLIRNMGENERLISMPRSIQTPK